MKGLFFGDSSNPIEKATVESLDVSLLAKGDGTEVILQEFNAGVIFYIYPGEEHETMEFYYLLEGSAINESKSWTVNKGDYFYTQNLEAPIYFRALTNMKILWVTSKPIFHSISSSIVELTKIVQQIEEKDKYTYEHSIRVQQYSLKIANELNLSTEMLENLYFASLFHDIGKIDIDEAILNKDGPLTDEEFEMMKKHSEIGCEIVKSSYYSQVSAIIHQHHERINGSGYPLRLKGDDILLEAQIIAVADTFDAMTSDRSYRKGMSFPRAIELIKRESGILYNPKVVDALERSLAKDKY